MSWLNNIQNHKVSHYESIELITQTNKTKTTVKISIAGKILIPENNQLTFPSKEIWKLHDVSYASDINEAGLSDQVKVLLSKDGMKVIGRVKSMANINEALVYHQLTQSNDPLCAHLPKYLGVLDKEGKQIDLAKELSELGEEGVRAKYSPAYLVMGDLLDNLQEGAELIGDIQDFKFAKSRFITNDGEVIKHGHKKHGAVYKWLKKGYFGLSGCAFAFQTSRKGHGWCTWVILGIKRVFAVINTKKALRSQFNQMTAEELRANVKSLEDLKTKLNESNYTFADSSLLFIPIKKVVDGVEKKHIDIKLIDLGRGMGRHEKIDGFVAMQTEMINSIEELISIMKAIADKKDHS